MPNSLPPKKGQAYSFEVALVSQANTKLMLTSVPLVAGDVTVSKDGAAFNNIGALPVEIGTTGVLVVTLSAGEMGGDRLCVRFSDVAGAAWCDLVLMIFTAARNFDDLTFPAVTGRSINLDTSGRVATAVIQSGSINAGVFSPGAITAAAFATDAIDANAVAASAVTEIQTGLATAAQVTALPTAAAIATAVWASASRTLTSFGTLAGDVWAYVTRTLTSSPASITAADVWANPTRTLTMTAAQLQASVSGSNLHIIRAVTFAATLSGINLPAGWDKLYFTVKRTPSQADTEALVQIVLSNPALGTDGLLVIDRQSATAGQTAWGSLVVQGSAITISLADDATLLLSAGEGARYDLKVLVDGLSVLVAAGAVTVAATPTATV